MARREGQRRALLPPPARVPILPRERDSTDLPAFLMLLGASAVVRAASASSSTSGDLVLAGFLLWLLGLVLSFHRARPFPRARAAERLRRFFVGRRPRRFVV